MITAAFSNVNLKGDIIHAMTSLAGMTVSIADATLTGGISTSNATQPTKPVQSDLSTVGRFQHAFGPVTGTNGLELTLGRNAKWVINKSSYLTALTVDASASLTAAKGYSVSMTVDGKATPIAPGTYKGAVVLTVNKS